MTDDDEDECPDTWHLGLPGDNDQRCPTCGWCEYCWGVTCDCGCSRESSGVPQ